MLATALSQYQQYFYTPSEVVADGFAARSDSVRVGGLVVPGSIVREPELRTVFRVRDFEGNAPGELTVSYVGVLPDLFKEDSGVVLTGQVDGAAMVASEVLAKHDENYMPKT